MRDVDDVAENRKIIVPINEKYTLTIREIAVYFNIGIKNMRRMAEDNKGAFAIMMGNRYLIVRTKFEAYIDSLVSREEEVQQ